MRVHKGTAALEQWQRKPCDSYIVPVRLLQASTSFFHLSSIKELLVLHLFAAISRPHLHCFAANLEENVKVQKEVNPVKINEPKTPYHGPLASDDEDLGISLYCHSFLSQYNLYDNMQSIAQSEDLASMQLIQTLAIVFKAKYGRCKFLQRQLVTQFFLIKSISTYTCGQYVFLCRRDIESSELRRWCEASIFLHASTCECGNWPSVPNLSVSAFSLASWERLAPCNQWRQVYGMRLLHSSMVVGCLLLWSILGDATEDCEAKAWGLMRPMFSVGRCWASS